MRRGLPLGIAEISALLSVKPRTVQVWGRRRVIPPPDGRVGGSPYWWERTIVVWARETGRMPSESGENGGQITSPQDEPDDE